MISKKVVNGKSVITTETSMIVKNWWRKNQTITTKRSFESQKQYPKGYWTWLELPDKLIVNDALSFQLNAWNQL